MFVSFQSIVVELKWPDIVCFESIRGKCHRGYMSLGVRRLSRPIQGQSKTDTTAQTSKTEVGPSD